jgi:hypothetical protein
MSDFLFHKVSEQEKEKIRKEARKLMDKFADKISKIKKLEEPLIEMEKCERQEHEKGEKCCDCNDSDFREIMFQNAPDKNKDFIIAEKKKW